MAPMVEEFALQVEKMREDGASDAELAAMLDRVERENHGDVDDSILKVIMTELRRIVQAPESANPDGSANGKH